MQPKDGFPLRVIALRGQVQRPFLRCRDRCNRTGREADRQERRCIQKIRNQEHRDARELIQLGMYGGEAVKSQCDRQVQSRAQ